MCVCVCVCVCVPSFPAHVCVCMFVRVCVCVCQCSWLLSVVNFREDQTHTVPCDPMFCADIYLCMYRKPAALHPLYTLAGAFEERIRATPEGPDYQETKHLRRAQHDCFFLKNVCHSKHVQILFIPADSSRGWQSQRWRIRPILRPSCSG